MTKLLPFLFFVLIVACATGTKSEDNPSSAAAADSTLYGTCGEGTTMHTLQLITSLPDTLYLHLADEDDDSVEVVVGHLLAGDRMAVIAQRDGTSGIATKVINITSLLGEWHDAARTFTLTDDGGVRSADADDGTWTAWRILNGHLLLDSDTFDIVHLAADSMELENAVGIFAFARTTTALTVAQPDSIACEE